MRWKIIDASGEVQAEGATEGQAWMNLRHEWLRHRVGLFDGWFFLGWVRGHRDHGYRAVEVG